MSDLLRIFARRDQATRAGGQRTHKRPGFAVLRFKAFEQTSIAGNALPDQMLAVSLIKALDDGFANATD